MEFLLDGARVRYADGGRGVSRADPAVVLIHGSGMNRTAWQLQTRYLSHHGFRAVAIDLPGHGGSVGPALTSIPEMANWTGHLIAALDLGPAHLVGHSMGSYVGLEVAARMPEQAASLVLCGTAATMPVHPELLDAATDNVAHASRLMTSWGFSSRGHTGAHASPGQWLLGGSTALIDTAPAGSLGIDMAACQAYDAAVERASEVTCPTTMVLGSADKMTPVRASVPLQEAFASAPEVVILDGVGHMMMSEAPDRVRQAIVDALHRGGNPTP